MLAFYFSANVKAGAGARPMEGASGGSGAGYYVSEPAEDAVASPDVGTLLSHAALPAVPSDILPSSLPDPVQQPALEPASTDNSDILAFSTGQTLGRPKPRRATTVHNPSAAVLPATVRAPGGVVVAPPLPDTHPGSRGPNGAVASANANSGSGTGQHGSGEGDEDDHGGDPFMPLTKADAEAGAGIDRGGSGANNPEPTNLMGPTALEVESARPTRDIKCKVTVAADGHIVKAVIIQSCGQPALDELWRLKVLHEAKYRPAYRDGRPYTADTEYNCNFTR
jgi:hypothetical protein